MVPYPLPPAAAVKPAPGSRHARAGSPVSWWPGMRRGAAHLGGGSGSAEGSGEDHPGSRGCEDGRDREDVDRCGHGERSCRGGCGDDDPLERVHPRQPIRRLGWRRISLTPSSSLVAGPEPGPRNRLRRSVHADDTAIAPDQAGGDEGHISRPTAQIQHTHARTNPSRSQDGARGGGKRPALEVQACQLVFIAAQLVSAAGAITHAVPSDPGRAGPANGRLSGPAPHRGQCGPGPRPPGSIVGGHEWAHQADTSQRQKARQMGSTLGE